MERIRGSIEYNYHNMVVLCREVDKKSGRVTVFEMDMYQEGDKLSLKLRPPCETSRRYFVTTKPRWDGPWKEDYLTILKRKTVSQAALKLIGGLLEI